VKGRFEGDFPVVTLRVLCMDVAPNQIQSVAAAIPFLSTTTPTVH
jgi:hypothetical protein